MNAHLTAVIALCDTARLDVLRIELRGRQIAAYVAPLRVSPETVVKRLALAMTAPSPYSIGYNVHVEDGSESFWFTPKAGAL